jgi:hypothetical protein
MKLKILVLAGMATTFLALPAIAHHSFAMFDASRDVKVTGTVTDFEWINPHVWLHVSVKGDNGAEEVWSFEAGSTGQLTQSFWTRDSVAAGDVIEVNFHPLKDGSNGGQLLDIIKADGTNLCQGAECRERLREQGELPNG